MRAVWIILSIPLLALTVWFIFEMARDICGQIKFNRECDNFLRELDTDD